MAELSIYDLHVTVDTKEILTGVTLTIPDGQVHALMGPNGSGKSTLAQTIAGHPRYSVTSGSVRYNGRDVLKLSPDERAKLGLFLSFQYPQEITGVSIGNFLLTALNARRNEPMSVSDAYALIKGRAASLGMAENIIGRNVNEGFSGGEKKRAEMLQLAVLEPSMAILDETDSGLDVDALKSVAAGINAMRRPDRSFLIITHYPRLLEYVKPDQVHVLQNGRIALSGGPELAIQLEQEGFANPKL